MHIKKLVLCLLMFLLLGTVFAAGPKVAVLDAVVRSGVNKSVVVPITENIIEYLVASGKYTVLDRLHIAKVMEEKQFQVSGIVKNEDIKTVGNYLGADIIAVIDISIVEDIYFVSAKMIDVESGQIINQASHKGRGDISVIFDIAETVGAKLAGGKVEIPVEPRPVDLVVEGDVKLFESELTNDGKILFHVYDITVKGMKGKVIHLELWLSQGDDLVPDAVQYGDPEEVLYDTAAWNGLTATFSYSADKIRSFGDPAKPYLATLYIVDTNADEEIFYKELTFTLPAVKATPKPAVTSKPTPRITAAPQVKNETQSHLTASVIFPALFNNVMDIWSEWLAVNNLSEDRLLPTFIDLHLLYQSKPGVYVSALFAGNNLMLDTGINFATIVNAQVGGGGVFPISSIIQGFIGLRAGICSLILEEWWGNFGFNQLGLSMTLETGVDLILFKFLCLSTRLQYETCIFADDFENGEVVFPSITFGSSAEGDGLYFLDSFGLSIGLGIAF